MRSLSYSLVVAGLTLLLGRAALAQEPVPLAFRFAAGDVMDYDVTMTGAGGLRAPDGSFSPVGVRGSFRVSISVTESLPDGSARLQARIPYGDLTISIAQTRARFSYEGGRLRWYSNDTEQAPPDTDLTRALLLGAPLEVILSPSGRVVEIPLNSLPQIAELMQRISGVGPLQLQDLGDPVFPDTPVRVGETWTRDTQITPLGPAVPITVSLSRTLDSFTTEGGIGLARIGGYSELRLRSSAITISQAKGATTFSIPELRRAVTSTEFFNTTQGRLLRGDYDSSLVARVSLGLGEKSQEAGLEARFHSTVQAR